VSARGGSPAAEEPATLAAVVDSTPVSRALATGALFARTLVRALADSNATDDLLLGEELTSVGRMRALLPLMQASDEGRAILLERPRGCELDVGALQRLPEGTLGRAYANHLARCGLDPKALGVPVTRGRTALENYLLERVRQTHDLWHTVLGLGTAGYEEVLVHAFQWPQLGMPYSALVVGFGTPKHFALEGRFGLAVTALPDAVRAGREAAPLLAYYWERHLQEPLAHVRRALRVRPAREWRGLDRAA
jgi:ubiquinone biosynthesis protein COQ4